MTLIVLFFITLIFIIYSYLIYPSSLMYLAEMKRSENNDTEIQTVHIVIAAHNEEKWIANTVEKIMASGSAISPYTIYVGNDDSTDDTSNILTQLQSQHSQLIVENYYRIGKSNVLNSIIEKYQLNQNENAIVFMDANIAMDIDTLQKMIDCLRTQDVGMVGASVWPMNRNDNVEENYILRENKIKSNESKAFGIAIGVFGACYAMHGHLYSKIPENFITDDLYQTLEMIRKKHQIYFSEEIRVYEDITAEPHNEFNRKKRFAAGNFQILVHFLDLLNPFKTNIGHIYAYFFHKVIRWIAPVLVFSFWIISLLTFSSSVFYIIRISGIFILLFLFFNHYLIGRGKPVLLPRIHYFLLMNCAILLGFFSFVKGIKTNVWERSERY